MENGKIILVGSVHIDPNGPKRLERMLEYFKPEVICLEATQQSADEAMQAHNLSSLQIEQLIQQFPFFEEDYKKRIELVISCAGYEVWVPKTYKNNSPPILRYIDKDITDLIKDIEFIESIKAIEQFEKSKADSGFYAENMTIEEFVFNCSEKEFGQRVDDMYDNTQFFLRLLKKFGQYRINKLANERDENFAKQINAIRQENPQKSIMAVLGAGHIFGEYPGNTYDLLSELNPQRIKLKEADKL